MEFDFSSEQNELRIAVRRLLDERMDAAALRRLAAPDRVGVGVDDALWARFVELGWTALFVPERFGGAGGTLVDVVILLEEMGRVPLPGPFLASAGLAARAAVLLDDADLLTALVSGVVATVAVEEYGSAGDPLGAITTSAVPRGDGWELTGSKPLVPDAHLADRVVVCARTGDGGLAAFVVDAPEMCPEPVLDPTRALGRLVLEATPARRIGPPGDQTALWRRWADDAAVMLCAESVGAGERAFELTKDYAKTRVQFGRPIGTFQAVKHIAADMLQDLTLARVGVHYAAWAADTDAPDREVAAAMAKAWTGEALVRLTGNAIQVHGGVGFTWEALVHLHFKRVKTNDLLLGRQGWQRQRVADLLLGPVGAESVGAS